jgi:hypothetical protein
MILNQEKADGGDVKKALYFLAMALLVMGLALLAGGAAAALGRLVRPFSNTLSARDFVSGLPALEPDLKLVVARLDFVKTASAESRKQCWGVDWGTTKAALSVPARAHYAIDLSGPAPVTFNLDSRSQTLTAVFPDPEVQSVEVFSHLKTSVTEAGWGRLEAFSGQALLENLDRGLYAAARRDAAGPKTLEQVKNQARPALARLVLAYAQSSLAAHSAIVVRFRSEDPSPGGTSRDGLKLQHPEKKS